MEVTMKKKKKLLAAVMSVCMMATAILPSFTAYAEDMNGYQIQAEEQVQSEETEFVEDESEVASPSDAIPKEMVTDYAVAGPSDSDINDWLDENFKTDETGNLTLPCTPYFYYDYNDEEVEFDTSSLKFDVQAYDIGTGKKVINDTIVQNEDCDFFKDYDFQANKIYYLEITENYKDVDTGDYYCDFDDDTRDYYILPITKEALEAAFNGGEYSVEYMGSSAPDYDSLPDVIFLAKEYQYDGWYPANITDTGDMWYLNSFEFYNYLTDGIKIKFTGEKDYTINNVPSDPSRFEYAVERTKIEKTQFISSNTSGGNKGFIDIFNGNEDGTIESNTYTISKNKACEFIVYEKTPQPADTSTHQYEYDDTQYNYLVAWLDTSVPSNIEIDDANDYESGLYYGIIIGNVSEPIKAEQDENGVYIIPDNNFVNKEYVQGTSVSLKGKNDYKADGKESDASEFEYRLTGWPGTDGYVDLTCNSDGTIQFPNPVFLGYGDTIDTTITIFQTTKQPNDTETTRYSYDPSVYQFKIEFVTKAEAVSYGIDLSVIDEIDNEYILVYKDYSDLTWKAADFENGNFTISDIKFVNRKDGKEADSFTVQFHTNGGGCIPAYTDVKKGSLITEPDTPLKEGFDFSGWYKDNELTTLWNFEHDTINANVVLYAKWSKKETPKPDGNGNSGNGGSTIHGGSSSSGGGSHSSSSSIKTTDPGWFKNNNIWYYKDYQTNSLKKGWHLDPNDGYWYYLDLNDGHMYIGWNLIDGKWYYFNPEELAPNQTWFINSNGRWYYNNVNKTKPFGSMYSSEQTPDGYTVNEKGEWLQ